MNKNLNLVEILKDCPKGTKFYSPIYGNVELIRVRKNDDGDYPIEVKASDGSIDNFVKDGRTYIGFDGECMLFPSKEQRDWSKFKTKKPKFDPKTFQPFDKVLGRCNDQQLWLCDLYSYSSRIDDPYRHRCVRSGYKYCIPYNDDTKHLVATKEEAPEFYRYWED